MNTREEEKKTRRVVMFFIILYLVHADIRTIDVTFANVKNKTLKSISCYSFMNQNDIILIRLKKDWDAV